MNQPNSNGFPDKHAMPGRKRHAQWIKQFYRWIGYYVALLASKTPCTPNMITISRLFFISTASIFIYWNYSIPHHRILIIVCIFLFSMLDAADGSLATLTDNKTDLGAWLDPQIDRIGFLILFISISAHLAENERSLFWAIFPLVVLQVFYMRNLVHSDIRLKEKFKNLRAYSVRREKEPDQRSAARETTAREGVVAILKLQFLPHTHNVALYIMISVGTGCLKLGMVFIGLMLFVWYIWANVNVIRGAVSLTRK